MAVPIATPPIVLGNKPVSVARPMNIFAAVDGVTVEILPFWNFVIICL
jgi:hypothetical protein